MPISDPNFCLTWLKFRSFHFYTPPPTFHNFLELGLTGLRKMLLLKQRIIKDTKDQLEEEVHRVRSKNGSEHRTLHLWGVGVPQPPSTRMCSQTWYLPKPCHLWMFIEVSSQGFSCSACMESYLIPGLPRKWTMWWLILCSNLTGVRDAQIAGKTLFSGVSVKMFLEENHLKQ